MDKGPKPLAEWLVERRPLTLGIAKDIAEWKKLRDEGWEISVLVIGDDLLALGFHGPWPRHQRVKPSSKPLRRPAAPLTERPPPMEAFDRAGASELLAGHHGRLPGRLETGEDLRV